jgi:hypothetical protein
LQSIRELGRSIAGDNYAEIEGAALGGTTVPDLLARRPDLLVVIGGDGTLHGVLGSLLAAGSDRPLPSVLAVPAGTTNMSALDLGVRGTPVQVLNRLRARLDHKNGMVLSATSRPVMKVSRAGLPPLCGMFFGAGIIARGVEYFTSHIRDRGITGEAASGLVVARFLGALVAGDRRGLTAPVEAQIEGLPGLAGRRPYVAILASVLDRLLLGMRPYWGTEPAPLHVTAVQSRPARLYRSLLPLLRGRGAGLRVEHGYASANLQSLSVQLEGPFVIDGQCYQAQGAAISLGIAGQISFVRP